MDSQQPQQHDRSQGLQPEGELEYQRLPPPPQQQQQQQQPQRRRPQPPPPSSGGDLVGIGVMVLISVAFVLIVFSSSMSTSGSSWYILHQVPEGHVGVYWRGGALLKTITNPGFHLKLPLVTKFEPIQVTLQTDQVVNRLRKEYVYETLLNYGVHYDKTWIYDKIHHEINQFCSAHTLQQVYIDMFDQIDEKMKEAIQRDCTQYAPGIEIIGVRVTKPNIPASIKRNFELMEEERTKALIAMERQKVAEKEAETQKKIALSEAEKNAQVSKILMEQKLMERDSAKRQQEIENQMYVAREKSQADASFYRVTKEAEANRLKLTPEYLELKFIESIANNSKIFFGDKVPNMVMDQRLLGNFLSGIAQRDHVEI
ncbi:erlin-2-B isoform X2 [Ananas comosus]|uniref:Erlin-2-B isoform X2 n=1 Tax=Ananas comosus TaxID=4615 RepID=A0A6P5G6R1_ANACO|nr:erlin-2-B isoform X2 [Ananas comosus]